VNAHFLKDISIPPTVAGAQLMVTNSVNSGAFFRLVASSPVSDAFTHFAIESINLITSM
jgi:hypothetical protein